MTVPEIITAIRSILNDEAPTYKWQESALVRWLNEAENQACRRAHLLMDASTSSICILSISASVRVYSLHSKVLQVKWMTIPDTATPLFQVTRDTLYGDNPLWVSAYGIPDGFITEYRNELQLTKYPQTSTYASMMVARLPLATFSNGATEYPEVPEEYHSDLVDWVLKMAYSRRDPDTMDMNLSGFYEGKFAVRFGPLPTAKMERLKKSMAANPAARAREFGT